VSHLWSKDTSGEWVSRPLEGDLVHLTPGGPSTLNAPERLGSVEEPVLVRLASHREAARWALICAPGSRARVNGVPVPVGARVLRDRDAIAPGEGPTVFFSTERPAQIVAFPDDAHDTFCIRCKLPLEAGTPAVRCPGRECGFWHHESPEHPCWSYADGCASCGYPTALDAGLQWTPAAL